MRILLISICFFCLSLMANAELHPVLLERIEILAEWLTPAPSTHFVAPFSERTFWSAEAESPAGRALIAAADTYSTEPIPALTERLYAEYQETKLRHTFEVPYGQRTARLNAFVFAFGMTGEARYLPLIEAEIGAILTEPSWAVPAHLGGRAWEDGYDYYDIAAASRVWSLATVDWLMQDHLLPATRASIRREAEARVFEPYRKRSRANDSGDFWWMDTHNNWNAICHSGVVGSALLLCESPLERAEFVEAFEVYTSYFLDGFTSDGFCEEGIAYWNYGFSHYLYGAEAIRLATGGKLDLMAQEKIKKITAFDQRWEVANGIFPAFGDAWFQTRPSKVIHDYAAIRFNSGSLLGRGDPLRHHIFGAFMYQTLFDLSLPRDAYTERGVSKAKALRDWFPEGGSLIARGMTANEGLSVAIKGGYNDQSHNHNDLGSFIVVNDGVLALTDLGADTYTKDTFGPNRYSSEILNSYGHPVPLVAGQLQKTGADAKAVTVRIELTDEQDLWEMDLTSAYDVLDLVRLTRTFIFTREGEGKLEIIDDVQFSSPQAFGTAILLRNQQTYESIDEQNILVSSEGQQVSVHYECLTGEALLSSENRDLKGILEAEPSRGIRLGFDLEVPVTRAQVRLTIQSGSSTASSL